MVESHCGERRRRRARVQRGDAGVRMKESGAARFDLGVKG
jgi:hypothetical protein